MKLLERFKDFKALFIKRSFGSYLVLGDTALLLVATVAFIIYGAVDQYFDVVIFLDFVLALLASFGYFCFGDVKVFRWLNLFASVFTSLAIDFFLMNSFPVWADRLNGITMYASRGTLFPVIFIIVVSLIADVALIVSCFMKAEVRESGKAEVK